MPRTIAIAVVAYDSHGDCQTIRTKCRSLPISADVLTVAIEAGRNDGNGENSGHVFVFQYKGTAWTQLGADIDGEVADHCSTLVGISALSTSRTNIPLFIYLVVLAPSVWQMPVRIPTEANVSIEFYVYWSVLQCVIVLVCHSNFYMLCLVFLCTAETPWLDGKHVVFGKVISGQDVVSAIEQVGSDSGRTRVTGKLVVPPCRNTCFCLSIILL